MESIGKTVDRLPFGLTNAIRERFSLDLSPTSYFPKCVNVQCVLHKGLQEGLKVLGVGYCWKVSKSRKNPFDEIESCGENGKTGAGTRMMVGGMEVQ
jgi:hypothetical protein